MTARVTFHNKFTKKLPIRPPRAAGFSPREVSKSRSLVGSALRIVRFILSAQDGPQSGPYLTSSALRRAETGFPARVGPASPPVRVLGPGLPGLRQSKERMDAATGAHPLDIDLPYSWKSAPQSAEQGLHPVMDRLKPPAPRASGHLPTDKPTH